jgi:hypothetical protein
MPPKRQIKKLAKKASTPPACFPRNKDLPRELLPIVGNMTLKSNIEEELEEFTKVNEYLPSLSLVSQFNHPNLVSPIESFEVIGEPDGYFLNVSAKLKGETDPTNLELFLKRVHLVEPIQAMDNTYVLPEDGALPQDGDAWKKTLTKVHSPYNEAYIDSLCAATMSRLVETGKSPHWTRFYGTFNSRVKKYVYNISDEYASLRRERWFDKNKKAGIFSLITVGDDPYKKSSIEIVEGGGFNLECDKLEESSVISKSTLSSCKSDTPSTDDDAPLEVISEPLVKLTKIGTPSVTDKASSGESSSSESSSDESESESSDESDSSSSESESDTDGSSSSSSSSCTANSRNDDCEFYAQLPNFPVQVTMYERCENTMDALLELEEETDDDMLQDSKDERWSAWIFQVIAALSVAQHYYGFIHNDLHTNNIMWCGTEEEYLYYRLDAKTYYRVPTFGNLMKVIDFGRATFYLGKELLMPDAFEDGADAGGQYNCPPFYDESEPRIDPNPSFDLCRLAVSMFDALYPDTPGIKTPEKIVAEEPGRISYETDSELYNILWSWLTDNSGKNILRNPDDSERFPDFDLYKHIGRHARNCIPRLEARRPYFQKSFQIEKSKIPEGVTIWEIPA